LDGATLPKTGSAPRWALRVARMETYRIRYLDGANPVSAIELVREFMGVGLRVAKELVETRGVILDKVSAAEARRVAERFATIGAEVEVERIWRHAYAYDPHDPVRGDQSIQRLRAGELELAVDTGPLGALEGGEPQSFADEALTQRRVVAQLERWTQDGLALADSEIAVLEAISERDPVLEAQLRERPEDIATHLIYGDWLQSRGDPRGQLVALQHACAMAEAAGESASELAELRRRERDFRRRHLGHLFGPLRPVAEIVVVRWLLGFIDAAFVGAARRHARGGPLQVLEDLLRLPIAARMRSLGLTSALLRRPRLERLLCESEVVAWLRELELGDHVPTAGSAAASAMPRFSRLWPHLRVLEKLTIHSDHPPLRALHSPTLEHLELHMFGLPDSFPEHFVAGRLPRLHTLTLDFASADRVSPAAFADLLALPELDGITELVLRLPNHPVPHALANVLASIPRLASLETLDLSRCVVDEQAMDAIMHARDRGRLPDGLLLPATGAPSLMEVPWNQ
jgi:uncharacterized protein (TIGR02996 family)